MKIGFMFQVLVYLVDYKRSITPLRSGMVAPKSLAPVGRVSDWKAG